jgi:hypothetical protein
MKTAELEGEELDYWVAKAEGYEGPCEMWEVVNFGSAGGPVLMKNEHCKHKKCYPIKKYGSMQGTFGGCPEFSTNWSWAGPLIEKEQITIYSPKGSNNPDVPWSATIIGDLTNKGILNQGSEDGPTPLVAAMRTYVTSKFGDEVEMDGK